MSVTPSSAPDQFDQDGNWIGMCLECGTSHEGYWPDTFSAEMSCLRTRAKAIGAEHLEAKMDQAEATMAERRNEGIRRFFAS